MLKCVCSRVCDDAVRCLPPEVLFVFGDVLHEENQEVAARRSGELCRNFKCQTAPSIAPSGTRSDAAERGGSPQVQNIFAGRAVRRKRMLDIAFVDVGSGPGK